MQKGFAPLIIILGILVILGIAGGAFYLGRSTISNPSPTPAVTSQITPPLNPSTNPAPTGSGETDNWKTYTDDQDRYAFKYPQNLNLKMPIPSATENTVVFTFEENTVNLTANQLKLAVTSYSDGQTLEQIINKIQLAIQAAGQKFRPKEVSLTGNKAYRYENIIEGNSSSSITTSVSHKNIVYQITLFNATNENKFLYDQILSTFKFTN